MKKKNNTLTPIVNPIYREQGQSITMSFSDAIKEITSGKKVRRISWEDKTDYGILKDGWLTIHTKGKDHQWLVSDGDMEGNDWIVV